MIRFAVALALLAGMASAEASPSNTYMGLTLGTPLPDTMTPLTSRIVAQQGDSDGVPDALLPLCEHGLLGFGASDLRVISTGCDGPIQWIAASKTLASFFDPADTAVELTTELDGLDFHETTLAAVRARFCSEGLIANTFFRQAEPDAFGSFALAYEIAPTGNYASFVFALPRDQFMFGLPPKEDTVIDRDAAILTGVNLMSSDLFDVLSDGPAAPSAGYQPIADVFAGDATSTSQCPLS